MAHVEDEIREETLRQQNQCQLSGTHVSQEGHSFTICIICSHLSRLSSHNHKLLRTLHQEAGEPLAENRLDLVRLLYSDTYPHTVYAGFDEASLLVIPAYGYRVEEEFFARPEDTTDGATEFKSTVVFSISRRNDSMHFSTPFKHSRVMTTGSAYVARFSCHEISRCTHAFMAPFHVSC